MVVSAKLKITGFQKPLDNAMNEPTSIPEMERGSVRNRNALIQSNVFAMPKFRNFRFETIKRIKVFVLKKIYVNSYKKLGNEKDINSYFYQYVIDHLFSK